jgi:hypothetical protein
MGKRITLRARRNSHYRERQHRAQHPQAVSEQTNIPDRIGVGTELILVAFRRPVCRIAGTIRYRRNARAAWLDKYSLRDEKKRAQKELQRLEKAISAFGKLVGKRTVKARRKLSAAARKRIAAAQRSRWAKFKAK